MQFQINNIIDQDDGSAIVDIDISMELRVFVRKYYKRKRCTNKLLSRFLVEGFTNYARIRVLCKK